MKIKMMTLYAGPGGVMTPGSVYDVDQKIGQALVAGKYAVRVDPQAVAEVLEAETLTVDEIETEALPAPITNKPRRGKRAA